MLHNKKWVCAYCDREKIEQLSKQLGISELVSSVLVKRGITGIDDARRFLHPSLEDLADPFLLPDMQVSAERILMALKKGEKICIYGDYDVDGITSVSIIIKVFRLLGADVFYYIPNRLDEGYGLNKQALDEIYRMGAELVITVDCGIVSFDEVEYGNSLGMDFLITDHHRCQERIPPALGVINPRRKDSTYPFKELAGVGVAYKLCKALELNTGANYTEDLLDIVAVGTIADLVPLTGENRVIVREGLRVMQNTPNTGLEALIKVSGLEGKEINSWHVAFLLAPRINASGRLSSAQKGVELLLTEEPEKAYQLAKALDSDNRERQALENIMLEEAIKQAQEKGERNILVLASEDWHPGVLGIVSSRITERYNKPSILLCIEDGEARGSARSIPGLDLYDMLSRCSHFYNKFGGHKQAAGLSMDADKLKAFSREIEKIAFEYMKDIERRPIIEADGDLTDSPVYLEDAKELKNLEPFGCANPSPLFIKRNVEVMEARRVGQNREHLKLLVRSCGQEVDCIVFGWGEQADPIAGEKVDIAFTPDINRWMDRENLQFYIKDIKRIETSPAFLSRCYTSMNRLVEKEEGCREIDRGFFESINVEKVENKAGYLYEIFQESTGNIAVTNSYKTAIGSISVLSLTNNTYLRFGHLEEYRKDKNYLIIYPAEFKSRENYSGNLYLCDPFLLPGQVERLKELPGVNIILLLDKDEVPLEKELVELMPSRQVFKEVYTLIRKRPGIGFYQCLYTIRRKGYNPLAIIRAIDSLRYAGLVEVNSSKLMPLPSPGKKVDIRMTVPYSLFQGFIDLARDSFNAVKNISVDI